MSTLNNHYHLKYLNHISYTGLCLFHLSNVVTWVLLMMLFQCICELLNNTSSQYHQEHFTIQPMCSIWSSYLTLSQLIRITLHLKLWNELPLNSASPQNLPQNKQSPTVISLSLHHPTGFTFQPHLFKNSYPDPLNPSPQPSTKIDLTTALPSLSPVFMETGLTPPLSMNL